MEGGRLKDLRWVGEWVATIGSRSAGWGGRWRDSRKLQIYWSLNIWCSARQQNHRTHKVWSFWDGTTNGWDNSRIQKHPPIKLPDVVSLSSLQQRAASWNQHKVMGKKKIRKVSKTRFSVNVWNVVTSCPQSVLCISLWIRLSSIRMSSETVLSKQGPMEGQNHIQREKQQVLVIKPNKQKSQKI